MQFKVSSKYFSQETLTILAGSKYTDSVLASTPTECKSMSKNRPDDPKQTSEPSAQAQGGNARAKKLTPEERSEIARKAVQARWDKAKKEKENPKMSEDKGERLPVAKYKGELGIMGVELPCYVLDNGQRVIG